MRENRIEGRLSPCGAAAFLMPGSGAAEVHFSFSTVAVGGGRAAGTRVKKGLRGGEGRPKCVLMPIKYEHMFFYYESVNKKRTI